MAHSRRLVNAFAEAQHLQPQHLRLVTAGGDRMRPNQRLSDYDVQGLCWCGRIWLYSFL